MRTELQCFFLNNARHHDAMAGMKLLCCTMRIVYCIVPGKGGSPEPPRTPPAYVPARYNAICVEKVNYVKIEPVPFVVSCCGKSTVYNVYLKVYN